MTTRLFFAATLILPAPLFLTMRAAHAQNAPPPATAPSLPAAQESQAPPVPDPPPPERRGENGDHAWAPRRDLGRGDRPGPGSARDRDHGHAGGWDREGDRDDALLPFGMWWKNPEVVNRIGLTLDQQKRILDFFIQSRVKLITLHATLQEEQLLLEPILDVTHLDSAKALAQIDKIADTRADLEKTNARMLLNIRGVLTPDQWATLRSHDHGPRDHDNRGPQGPSRSN